MTTNDEVIEEIHAWHERLLSVKSDFIIKKLKANKFTQFGCKWSSM